jgi:FeS assembly SUF system regulator
MLRLTKKADYGLIAVRHLAERRSASAKEIATSYGIPLPLLAKVLQKLARHRLLDSSHGTNGGYRLARDPRHITALEVIRAIDGPTILTSCSTHGAHCHQAGRCTVRAPLRKIQSGILELLDSITISEMREENPRAERLHTLSTGVSQ